MLSGGNPAERLLDAGTRRVWADVAALHRDLDTALAVASPGPARLTAQVLEQLMREALNAARAGLEAGEAPIGAVLARTGGEIVARGWNRLRASADPTAHAEIIAFREAAGCLPPGEEDLVLVSTVEPCTMCTGAAMEYGVEAVVYGAPAPLDGGTRRVTPPRHPGFRMPRMIGPVLPDAARALLAHWLPRAPDPRQRAWAESLLTPSP